MKAFIALCMVALAVAEPEADPALLYSGLGYSPYALGYAGYQGVPYAAGYAAAYSPYTYGAYGYSGLYGSYLGNRIFKREAEAEADPALLYSGLNSFAYGALPYAGYAGYHGYAAPYAYSHAIAPAVYSHAAPAAIPAVAGGYAAAGRYVANSAGVVHVAKREAEAEADPALLYSTLGYNAYAPYTAYAGYTGYAGLPYAAAYNAFPYSYGYRAGLYGRFF